MARSYRAHRFRLRLTWKQKRLLKGYFKRQHDNNYCLQSGSFRGIKKFKLVLRHFLQFLLGLFSGKWFNGDDRSFTVPGGVDITEVKLNIPEVKGGIRVGIDGELRGELDRAIITKTASGKYFVSLCMYNEAHSVIKKSLVSGGI